ncbi:hypothetical protein Ato02nite_024630 [Paractinoplanes toevensis]|uniref:Uncharacterized protein n=1 Tax=Paractinoplanes toevensis TaxID=571911 RepID=A0A919TA40_9ACTN|nr:hypothetical protein Ato02nite_024630 [Actinoplanes toevensis]
MRHYRRLLRAYPRAYRDHRGSEIITTLLEMAEDGRGRPGLRQTLHLVLAGLRQRFRLPARRPLVWVAAVLAAAALGAAGSAAGTRLGWQTAGSLPSDRELRALNAAMTGMPADAAVYREVSAMKGPHALVRADGGGDVSPQRLRAALTAAGWHLTSFEEQQGSLVTGTDLKGRTPISGVDYTATKGSLKLDGNGWAITGEARRGETVTAMYGTAVWPREAAAVRPLTIGGLLAGALAGWLLVAAFAYRVRRSGWPASATATAAFAAAAWPAHQLYREAYDVMMYAHGSPYPYVVRGPVDSTLPLACAVIAVLAIAVAAALATRPRRDPVAVPG